MRRLTRDLARFVADTQFECLPDSVVQEAKRVILDSVGCALAGIASAKGKCSIKLAKRLGGSESSIIGTGDKVSSNSAAFANGELINALDYDAILAPPNHVAPYVIPAALALGESKGATGKDLIIATVLGHEVATRISQALKESADVASGFKADKIMPASGYSQCILGSVVGAGKILKLGQRKTAHALGIAGHFCPVYTSEKFHETVPAAMTKFGSTGWISSAGVTAALLAETGYLGDTSLLDGKYGFWRFFGFKNWDSDKVMDKIGETWSILNTKYKQYPCCGLLATALDCFTNIIDKNDLSPDEIDNVHVYCSPLVDKPIWKNTKLNSHIDAQFSTPYIFSVAAHRVDIGIDWQKTNTIRNPRILKFMEKVRCHTHPRFEETARAHPGSNISLVEVVAKGDNFREERMYYKGTPFTELQATDKDLVRKFRYNAHNILNGEKIDRAVSALLTLETVKDVRGLMRLLVS